MAKHKKKKRVTVTTKTTRVTTLGSSPAEHERAAQRSAQVVITEAKRVESAKSCAVAIEALSYTFKALGAVAAHNGAAFTAARDTRRGPFDALLEASGAAVRARKHATKLCDGK